jgi:CRP-like cAMP-binding protein
MQREEFAGGLTVLTEGQFSNKLYVVETGYVQITVRSNFVKTIGKGGVIGDLSLTNTDEVIPMKSTAHCITKAILWSLSIEDLKRIEFTASSEMLLRGSLYEYFGVDKYSTEHDKIDLFVKSMVREEVKGGTTLIVEGDVGNKLFIIESGFFQISIKGQFIRTVGKGKVLGDLALLYDAPRSASAHAITDATIWSLHRDAFRQINIESSSNQFKKRAKWLINCPELAALSAVNFTRLVNSFQTKEVGEGVNVYLSKTLAIECVLIESGRAAVYIPSDDVMVGKSPAEMEAYLGVSRPAPEMRLKLSRELADYINGKGISLDEVDVDSTTDSSNGRSRPDSAQQVQEEVAALRLMGEGGRRPEGYFVCEVGEGCLLATGALKQTAENDTSNAWKCVNRTWKFADGAWHALKTSYGIQSPMTVRTLEPLKVCAFSFEAYDRLLESPDSVAVDETVGDEKSEKSMSFSLQSESTSTDLAKGVYDVSMFRAKYVLGKGSFAIVLLAELRADETHETVFALKIYDKKDVAANKQLKNVTRSCQLLKKITSPHVLKLHGTFQTPHQLYMVTEPLLHGSLWDVMTDAPFSRLGLPAPLVQYYAASLILALAHVHSIGAGYRELKPENVMFDGGGVLRLIDFGMCKKIPYTKTDSRGIQKLYAKSYTLFGTPGEDSNAVGG